MGNGGKGGDVILVTDTNLNTLIDFRYHQHFKAKKGEDGRGKNQNRIITNYTGINRKYYLSGSDAGQVSGSQSYSSTHSFTLPTITLTSGIPAP